MTVVVWKNVSKGKVRHKETGDRKERESERAPGCFSSSQSQMLQKSQQAVQTKEKQKNEGKTLVWFLLFTPRLDVMFVF